MKAATIGDRRHCAAECVDFANELSFALPPIDGLHASVHIFSGSPVTSSVGTPIRADARAASTPA